MKDLPRALRAFLLADAAIAARVADRVYPGKLPQGTVAESIVYNRISGAGDYAMDGLTGFAKHRLQIDAWSTTADGASSLADLIRDRIDGYRGPMGSGGNAVEVKGVFMLDQSEGYDDVAKLERMRRDYMITFGEL